MVDIAAPKFLEKGADDMSAGFIDINNIDWQTFHDTYHALLLVRKLDYSNNCEVKTILTNVWPLNVQSDSIRGHSVDQPYRIPEDYYN